MKADWYKKVEGKAEHLVYLDDKAKELEKLFSNNKTMIIRGAAGRKSPLGGRVKKDDILYFVETNKECLVTARAIVKNVIETDKMTEEESIQFVDKYSKELNLSSLQYKRWAGKKFLCLVEIDKLENIEPFKYNRENNMDDWVITDDINKIKVINKNPHQEYFDLVCNSDYPTFIDKYLPTKELQRINHIGQFCGSDYTKIYNIKTFYSRLDHSIVTALITWNFTKDKKQTISALFHDLGTPCFSHCIDYLLGDVITQESSEKSIFEVLKDSKEIKEYLKDDGLTLEDVADDSKYTIVENKKPKICADRLDGILHTSLNWLNAKTLKDVESIYTDIEVLINEDNEQEIGFKTKEKAEEFFDFVSIYSIELQKNKNKFIMSYISDSLKLLVDKKIITIDMLYIMKEKEILKLLEDNIKSFKTFENLTTVTSTDTKPINNYYASLDSKKRFVVPLVKYNGKTVRLDEISEKCKKQLEEYHNFKDKKYAYSDKIITID